MTTAQIRIGSVLLTIDGGDARELFKVAEQFSALSEHECGCCGSPDIRPSHRVAQGYDFYLFRCSACGARLELGTTKDGKVLFPRRKDKGGDWLPNKGWGKWQGNSDGESSDGEKSRETF